MMKKPFWYVWSPQGNVPKFRHENYWGAENEAQRLARNNPGQEFVVLESKVAFIVDSMQRTDFNSDADIPF